MKLLRVAFAVTLAVGFACTPPGDNDNNSNGSGGHGSGGSGSGGSGSGGSGSGGHGSGGSGSGSGGSGSGGSASGGSSSGGSGSGGSASGGSGSGSGGSGSGGSGSGGSGSGTGGSASGASGSGGSGSGGSMTGSGGGGGGRGGGAGSGAGGGSSGMADFMAVAQIMGSSCGTGTCHDGSTHVDLRNNSGLYDRLKGMPGGSLTMSGCKSMKLVVPNDASKSVLSKIVKASVSGCSNARMPDDCSTTSANPRRCLTQAQIDTIDSWIMAGATM